MPSTEPPKGQKSLSSFFGGGGSSRSSSASLAKESFSAKPASNSNANGAASKASATRPKPQPETVEISDSDNDAMAVPSVSSSNTKTAKSAPKPSATVASKRKVAIEDSDSDDDYDKKQKSSEPAAKKRVVSGATGKPKSPPKKNAANSPSTKPNAKGKGKEPSSNGENGGPEGMDIDEAIQRFAPTDFNIAQKDTEKKKAPWIPNRDRVGPTAPGSKEVPQGQPNCLAACNIVFTGELGSLAREEAVDLAKRYGAKVTGAPSSKTTHVVMGEGAGAGKLKKIKASKLACKILDEDGFFDLIRGSKAGKLDEKTLKKLKDEEKQIKEVAKEMQQPASTGKVTADNGFKLGGAVSGAGNPRLGEESSDALLWTTKYAPRKMKDLVGNKAGIEKLKNWLERWPKSLASNFKKPGPDASGTFRAVLLSGSPGIGKTSAAHLVSRSLGYTPIEMNASDIRSKKLIELALRDAINNTNLDGWYHGAQIGKSLGPDGVRITDKTVLIMDEVDGMGGGDRGGVGAINALIKKSKVPIICICNDRKSPKMKPFEHTTFNITFRKPEAQAVKSRLLSVAFNEKLKIPQEVMLSLIESAQGDIRLMLNMLSTWSLSQKTMTFDESKALGEANMKSGMHTPFTLYGELTGPGMFAPTSRKTLNDKADYYFQDPMFMPLLMHENYLKQRPSNNRDSGPMRELTSLLLFSQAAQSISDGDMIDSMIHGPQQHWSLMPQHAIASCVRPASFVYGPGSTFPSFPIWLGQNSKQNKLRRANVDVQARMRLSASGSADEVRLTYEPVLFELLSKPLIKDGANGIADVIDVMDEYFLGLEDREAILELGVGAHNGEEVTKRIPSAVKASFTRKYNSANHPVAFYKTIEVSASKVKQLEGDAAPDVEEAYDVDDEVVPDADEDENDGEDMDLSKNKLVKAKKQPSAAAKGKGKAKAVTKK